MMNVFQPAWPSGYRREKPEVLRSDQRNRWQLITNRECPSKTSFIGTGCAHVRMSVCVRVRVCVHMRICGDAGVCACTLRVRARACVHMRTYVGACLPIIGQSYIYKHGKMA